MDNIYIEYVFNVIPKEPGTEILIAELGYAGFESFVETATGVIAYVQKEEWNSEILQDVSILKSEEFSIDFEKKEIERLKNLKFRLIIEFLTFKYISSQNKKMRSQTKTSRYT